MPGAESILAPPAAPIVAAMGAVDDYFDSLDTATRDAFERVRKLALEIAPDAGQGTSYGMAVLTYEGRPLLGFRAAKQHLSIFPFSPEAVDAARDQLRDFDVSKGTIRFAADAPLPQGAVHEIARHRVTEIEQALGARQRSAGADRQIR
jgi:uncharacterized protein YdhG (YjbR/CyaY superfamily)